MKFKTILLTFLLVFGISPSSHAITVGEIVNPLEDYLDCEDTNSGLEEIACSRFRDIINTELEQANLRLDNGGILFTQTDNTNRNLEGGCSSRTGLRSLTTRAKLLSSARLNLTGDSLSRPALFLVDLPVEASVDARLKTTYGTRIPFVGCRSYASDSFNGRGKARGRAKMSVFLSLEPRLTRRYERRGAFGSRRGRWVNYLTIKPIVDVSATVDAKVERVRLSGTNPLFAAVGALAGIVGSQLRFNLSVLRGESFERSIKRLFLDRAIAEGQGLAYIDIALGGGHITNNVLTLIANYVAQEQIEDLNLSQVETDLEEDIKEALRLNSNGERSFRIGSLPF